jgi:hypothetical protein
MGLAMTSLTVLHGYCTLQVYKKVGGSTRWSHTIIWEVCGNTLVDEAKFPVFNQDRWIRMRNPKDGSYYVCRVECKGGKTTHIFLAREVLGLCRNPGRGNGVVDHKNHDKTDNTVENLREATTSQNAINKVKQKSGHKFRSVQENGNGHYSYIKADRLRIYLPTVLLEIEAAWMRCYAVIIVHDSFAHLENLPEDEKPSRERRWELLGMVVGKLVQKGLV